MPRATSAAMRVDPIDLPVDVLHVELHGVSEDHGAGAHVLDMCAVEVLSHRSDVGDLAVELRERPADDLLVLRLLVVLRLHDLLHLDTPQSKGLETLLEVSRKAIELRKFRLDRGRHVGHDGSLCTLAGFVHAGGDPVADSEDVATELEAHRHLVLELALVRVGLGLEVFHHGARGVHRGDELIHDPVIAFALLFQRREARLRRVRHRRDRERAVDRRRAQRRRPHPGQARLRSDRGRTSRHRHRPRCGALAASRARASTRARSLARTRLRILLRRPGHTVVRQDKVVGRSATGSSEGTRSDSSIMDLDLGGSA